MYQLLTSKRQENVTLLLPFVQKQRNRPSCKERFALRFGATAKVVITHQLAKCIK